MKILIIEVDEFEMMFFNCVMFVDKIVIRLFV